MRGGSARRLAFSAVGKELKLRKEAPMRSERDALTLATLTAEMMVAAMVDPLRGENRMGESEWG